MQKGERHTLMVPEPAKEGEMAGGRVKTHSKQT